MQAFSLSERQNLLVVLRSTHCQQLFEKSTDLTFSIHKVNLQNPMALLALFIERAHREMTGRMNVQGHLVSRDLFVRKMPNQVACNLAPKFPAEFLCERGCIGEELLRSNVGSLFEILFSFRERCTYVVP